MGREARFQAFSIIGMHAIDPFSQRRADILFGVAQHRLPARREVRLIVTQIPFPQPIVGAARGQGIALLALA